MNARNPLLSAAILAALQVPAAALAQSATTQLDEIVVTAQKREQRFGDVGISGTAYTGEALAEAGVAQLTDLALLTPNVQIKYVMANSIPNVTIRGIGLNDYAANNNPAAGIYIDDVYLVSPAMLTFGMFDLERVEVLKGPQGTLFGRNTTAGTINFISKKPTRRAGRLPHARRRQLRADPGRGRHRRPDHGHAVRRASRSRRSSRARASRPTA